MILNQLNILLADDDTDDCLFFREAINKFKPVSNFTVVHDGEQLMLWLINEKNKLPDVLFLDLNMPRKNGFECLSEIKQNKKLSDIPVVIFTTSFEKEMLNKLYDNGALYFVRKPSEFSVFRKIILYTLSLLIKDNILRPTRENFVLAV